MENSQNTFTPLLIVVLLGFLVPIILARFKKVHLPIVVGEILAGVLIGRSGFGWVTPGNPILDFIAQFGFVFLMFLSGMEIDFSSLQFIPGKKTSNKPPDQNPLFLTSISFGLTLVLAGLVSLLLVRMGIAKNLWMMGLILSTTSLGVVVPVLKEKRLISGSFGQVVLLAALIADFASMVLITTYVAVLSHGLTLDILLIGILFLAFFVALRFGKRFNQLPAARRTIEELSHATAQIKIRAAFAIMLAFVVLAETIGTEIILGAFLAGACVAILMTPEDKPISHQLESIGYGFLIPIFFINVGINFNLSVLIHSPGAMLLVPFLIIAAILVKIIPALVFRAMFNMRQTLAAGVLLSARLSLIIAASAIGLRMNLITEETNAAILLVAILTVTFAPLIFSTLIPAEETSQTQPIAVIGGGELGLQIAEQLQSHNEDVMIIDSNEERVARARKRGFKTHLTTENYNNLPDMAVLSRSKTLVCSIADVELCYQICTIARSIFHIPNIVARVPASGDIARFEKLGVRVSNAALDHASILTMLARNPGIYRLLTRTNDDKEVYEVLVQNRLCVERKLRQLELPGDTLVLAVRRNGDLLVPHGNTEIESGDYLTLVSSLEWVDQNRQMFNQCT